MKVISVHIVWDWNGTLLDDLDVVVESLNVGIASLGIAPIDADGYRDHFTRPVRAFYDSLFGRPVADMEWDFLDKVFHDEYASRSHRAPLTMGAQEAVARIAGLGWSQSVLSMSVHDQLLEAVASRGIADRFTFIDGLTVPGGGLKRRHLESHLASLDLDGGIVVLIGDTPDDSVAARRVGAEVILFDGGSHHLHTLKATGAPVARTLDEAVDIAWGLAQAEESEVMA